jgi:mannose-6-phosphate isomerase-like protein (cupin superfamily)
VATEPQSIEHMKTPKPWGYEVRFAVTDRYLGKVLHVNKGQELSLQYHVHKDECQLLWSGSIDLELQDSPDAEMRTYRLGPGRTVHRTPGVRHRITAVEDADIFEVSSPEITDVVRLEDRYGRAGTSAD